MIWTILLLTIGLIVIAVFLLSVKILFSKSKKFPETHIGRNMEMKKRGISCAISQDREIRKSSTNHNLLENKLE